MTIRASLIPVYFAATIPAISTYLFLDFFPKGTFSEFHMGLYKSLMLAFPAIMVFGIQKQKFRFERPSKRPLIFGGVFGLLVALGIIALYHLFLIGSPLFEGVPDRIWRVMEDFHVSTAARFWLLAAGISFVNSILEEYYWRWYIFGQLRGPWGYPMALLFSSLGFSVHHFFHLNAYLPSTSLALVLTFAVAVGGAFWAYLYDRSKSLYAPWISHVLIDIGLMYVGYDLLKDKFGV